MARLKWLRELGLAGRPYPGDLGLDAFADGFAAAAPKPHTAHEQALEVIQQPEFWCRARLFKALSAAKAKGVLLEVLTEIEDEGGLGRFEEYLDKHWRQP